MKRKLRKICISMLLIALFASIGYHIWRVNSVSRLIFLMYDITNCNDQFKNAYEDITKQFIFKEGDIIILKEIELNSNDTSKMAENYENQFVVPFRPHFLQVMLKYGYNFFREVEEVGHTKSIKDNIVEKVVDFKNKDVGEGGTSIISALTYAKQVIEREKVDEVIIVLFSDMVEQSMYGNFGDYNLEVTNASLEERIKSVPIPDFTNVKIYLVGDPSKNNTLPAQNIPWIQTFWREYFRRTNGIYIEKSDTISDLHPKK